LLSDVLGRELIQAEVNDASAIGAAIIGFQALGIPFKQQQTEWKLFQPDAARSACYRNNHTVFELLYQQLESLFNK
jgi:gluconokinase